MTEEAKAARNAYRREWAKRNPDKIKGQQERYWAKRAAERATAGTAATVTETRPE